ncbi:Hsp20/alpha crystallin family protein [bacterium]|nr:MAG: Hsp20/alpha crystallin family protein [bacterium]
MNTLHPMTRMLDALSQSHAENDRGQGHTTTPRADVLEGEKEYRIVLDLPGVGNDDLELNLEHQTLTVKAERSLDVPEGFTSRRAERSDKLAYARTFSLGNGVDMEGIKAALKDGVLEITLPKSQQGLPRRIEIN